MLIPNQLATVSEIRVSITTGPAANPAHGDDNTAMHSQSRNRIKPPHGSFIHTIKKQFVKEMVEGWVPPEPRISSRSGKGGGQT